MCIEVNYSVASMIHKKVYGVEIKPEQIKEQVKKIQAESSGLLNEKGAFRMWLKELNLDKEYDNFVSQKSNKNQNEKGEIMTKASDEAVKLLQKQITVESEDDAIMAMDNLDEDLILIEEAYEDLPLAYTYKDRNGKEKMILSWAGIVKAMRLQGNIEVEPPEFKEVSGKIIAVCRVRDLKRNITMIGTAERISPGKMGEEFKYTVLASKAIRNALKHIIEPIYLHKVLAEAKKRRSYVIISYG